MNRNKINTKKGFKGKLMLFFLLLLCMGRNGYAQIYPVQVTTQLAPPFSGYIGDYSTPGNQNLKLLVLFSDFTKPTYSIKLKMKISGQGITLQSKSYFYSQAFSVQPGIPFEISGSDLAELLNTNNLDFSGISIQQYEEKKALPEGFYNICFIAYDNNNPTQIQVSNESCAAGWMVLSDPPFLNLPMCGSVIKIIDPQNIFFQWTPMNLSSPNSAMNTLYDFELYEVKPAAQSPGNIIQTLPPIYKITTPLTSINYGMTEPQLYPAMEYVWRVRAHDLSGRDLFKNKGYSQICTFKYGNSLSQLDSNTLKLSLKGNALNHQLIKYTWDSLSIFSSYRLEYRKKGGVNWFPINTTTPEAIASKLEAENTYEARVKGISADGEGPWSNIVVITTPAKPIIACGQQTFTTSMANFKPHPFGKAGQFWNIGQFEMVVTDLEFSNNPSGQYSGYGTVEIPFLGGLNLVS
ncbi:MAG TPA: fibronectin type III domain-containing protein, partial [Bacteroidia bacterium]|nr:fibronectin type III domain-containing protein [Bacteroidia bacterium]